MGHSDPQNTAAPLIRVRPARSADRGFVRETAERLSDFDLPPWRSPAEIVAGEVRTIDAYFRGELPGAEVLVAEFDREPLGFAFHAHVGILAVASGSEGLGAGRALLAAAEDWTRTRGLSVLTLNVFDGNARARRLYERSGFETETRRYRKTVGTTARAVFEGEGR
jgi:GNAT superfamily N-acetyltransferase